MFVANNNNAQTVIYTYLLSKHFFDTDLITATGRNMLDSMSDPYMAAKVNVPKEASEFTELCRFEAPQNAVKCIMNAKPMMRTFFHILHFSPGEYSVTFSFSSVLTRLNLASMSKSLKKRNIVKKS